MSSIQSNRYASVTSPLGTDFLQFSRMSGSEEMSRLFEYEVDVLVGSENLGAIISAGFPTDKILGEAMSVALPLSSGGKRYYHGLVTQFRHHGSESANNQAMNDCLLYRAVLRPWLWFLTRTSNCRIFQGLSVPDIIKKVFETNGFSDFKLELTQSYSVRNYCVQYRESDFNFVSRLMECEGLFYFFKHEESSHTLVIGDSIGAYQSVSGYETVPYISSGNSRQIEKDHVFEWHMSHKVQSGAYVMNDYDFKKPKSNLVAKFQLAKQHSHAEGEQYDYPGNYRDQDTDDGLDSASGESYANIRLDELQTDYEVIKGSGNALGLTTGMLFTLKDHYIIPENTDHIIISAKFLIESNQNLIGSSVESFFQCDFMAIRSTQQFRPSRLTPVPFVQGPQTATVVGKAGEEVWTDKYGRIKVKFPWDRDEKNDETSSCWIRVSHPIAGKNWGWVSLPRIGQEVVVSFLEGNPDRPLITGSVYNDMQMPPYDLPANQTQSGLKSRSSKEGVAENANEFRFEDKKDAEEVYIHAEKDFNCVIENNETRKIGLDKQDKGDQTLEIQNDRTVTLNQGNDTLTVKMGNRESNIDTGNDTLNVKQGNYVVDIGAGKATITAMTSIELKVGSNSIKIEQSGITIMGVMVKVQADATLDAKSPMTTINGDGMLTLKGGMTMIN